ncbi:MAG: hypothetical protein JSV62_01020 [Promethearchaeota archaeon]|nr:MAG: hypothetical protein JSV62_01020 [Candidatus Lokiarchaeota archaeon]
MERSVSQIFRLVALIGLILLLFSVFLEWYSVQIYDFNNDLVVSWSYYFLTEWQTPFSSSSILNSIMRPDNATIPVVINYIIICGILASSYVILVKNIDNAEAIKNYMKFAYINIFLVLLVGYYVIISPILYLVPNEFYFPFLSVRNYELELLYVYAVGPGYILQLISFPLIFPYSIFYYRTVSAFIQKEREPEKIVQKIIENSQELIDLDKYIAEEELQSKLDTRLSERDAESLLITFVEGKK